MSKKRILIFAHYYYPDVASTGQLLQDLAESMTDEFEVTVICVVPSYGGAIEEKYKDKKYYFETFNNVSIIRVRVPEFNKSNKFSRMKNIMTYFFCALKASKKSGKQDYIFTISQPPILGGLLGVIGKRQKKAKMIYCIQDFNPEQIMAIEYSKNKPLLSFMMALDKHSCKKSDLVITVGRDLVETLKKRFHNKNVPKHVMINNWIDEKEIYPLPADDPNVLAFREKYDLSGKFVIMYSGNLGLYYDLYNLIKVIEKFPPGTVASDGREVSFAFVGDGSIKEYLIDYTKEHHMDNVAFIPYQEKEDLIYSLNAADVHWCVSAKGIKGVSTPSKWYGLAACAKPILGVLEEGSEIRMLIEETNCGWVSEPGEYDAVGQMIGQLLQNVDDQTLSEMGRKGQQYLSVHLRKETSIQKYISEIALL